jgi:hypothetical protein
MPTADRDDARRLFSQTEDRIHRLRSGQAHCQEDAASPFSPLTERAGGSVYLKRDDNDLTGFRRPVRSQREGT